jgi:hypothetical protein
VVGFQEITQKQIKKREAIRIDFRQAECTSNQRKLIRAIQMSAAGNGASYHAVPNNQEKRDGL